MVELKGELEQGTMLGKYQVHGLLSVGGMAELYLASLAGQGGFRKFVALKRVLPSISRNESFLKMFLDEARITASLSHAAIAQVFELTEDPLTHEPILAMEFISGQNVDQIIRRARARGVPLPLGFVCRVAREMLLALHFAHTFVEPATGTPMPVIHRDINPRNVMVTYTGGTKIVDFGIAKARGRLDRTQVGFVKGTVRYMAPEQLTVKEIDGRTDLFAASVLFYELFVGQRLFDEDSDAATMSAIVEGSPPSLAKMAPTLPAELVAAVLKGLERNPAARWRTGRDYARALDRAAPNVFDDEQMSELMSRLFADKIAVTRGLLSSAGQATPAELRLMTTTGDDEGPVSGRAPAPSSEVELGAQADLVTDSLHAQGSASEQTVLNLDPVAPKPQPSWATQATVETLLPAPVRRRTAEQQLNAPPRRRTSDALPAQPRLGARPEAPPIAKEWGSATYLIVIVLALALAVVLVLILSGHFDDRVVPGPVDLSPPAGPGVR